MEKYREIEIFFRISHTIILHDPFEDPPRLPIPDRSPLPGLELVTVSYIILLLMCHIFAALECFLSFL